MKRKWMALMLAVLLMAAMAAKAEPVLLFSDMMLEERLWVQGVAATPQGLLILTKEEGLYLREGDDQLPRKALAGEAPARMDLLVGDGHAAWLVNVYQGEAYAWQPGEALPQQPLSLDYTDLENQRGILFPQYAPHSVCLLEGRLYWLTEGSGLMSFDLADGSRQDHGLPQLKWIAAGPENSLLALSFDGVWDQKTAAFQPPHLARLSPQTGRWEDLGALPLSLEMNHPFVPFVYDEGIDQLVYAQDGGLYRLPLTGDQPPVLAAYLPDRVRAGAGLCASPLTMLSGGQLAAVTGSGILLSDIRGEAPPRVALTLADTNGRLYFDGTAPRRAALQALHMQVTKQPMFWDQEDFNLKIITGTQQPDIFLLDTSQDNLASLMDKGYLMDLSQSAALTQLVEKTWPQVRQSITRDGALFALPISLSFGTWITRDNALKEAGLQPPADFFAYCDMLEKWYDGPMDAFPQWTPQPATQDPAGDVLRLGYGLYIQHIRGSGQPLAFDTPLFRRMMQRGLSLQPDGETQESIETEAVLRSESFQMLLDIMSIGSSYLPILEHVVMPQQQMAEFVVQPSADAGLAPTPRGALTVLAVNPRSPNREEALRYLEVNAQNLDWQDSLMLGLTAPADIPNPDYERTIFLMEQEAKRLTQALEGLSGAQRREAEDRLQRHLQWLDTSRQTQRLLLSLEEGKRAQDKASAAYIRDAAQSPEYHPAMRELFERLIAGGMNLDMFIREADQRLRLIEQESR